MPILATVPRIRRAGIRGGEFPVAAGLAWVPDFKERSDNVVGWLCRLTRDLTCLAGYPDKNYSAVASRDLTCALVNLTFLEAQFTSISTARLLLGSGIQLLTEESTVKM